MMPQIDREVIGEFEALVEEWKSIPFCPESLLLVDKRMLRLIAAWPSVQRRIEEPTRCRNNAWSWLKFNAKVWELLAGVHVLNWDSVFARLVALRLIGPDGSVPKAAREFIRRRADERLPKQRGPAECRSS
jgi:hypothetical protein